MFPTSPVPVNKIVYFCRNENSIMKHISLASIEKAIQKVDNLDEDGLERIAETYALAQQVLLLSLIHI